MKPMCSICLALAAWLSIAAAALLASQARDQGHAVFIYPKDVQSERDLSECPGHTACSVLYRRFWLPPLVERHCRCAAPSECGWSWATAPDDRTLTLDNRAQLKFCTGLKGLGDCTATQTALKLSPHALHHTTSRPLSARTKPHRVSGPHAVTALCHCPHPRHWAPATQGPEPTYRCTQLDTCSESEVCGFVRTDLYSTAYQCSCSIGQQCVTRDKRTHVHHLPLYTGPVYTALCTRVNEP